jgi:hypothetical protein
MTSALASATAPLWPATSASSSRWTTTACVAQRWLVRWLCSRTRLHRRLQSPQDWSFSITACNMSSEAPCTGGYIFETEPVKRWATENLGNMHSTCFYLGCSTADTYKTPKAAITTACSAAAVAAAVWCVNIYRDCCAALPQLMQYCCCCSSRQQLRLRVLYDQHYDHDSYEAQQYSNTLHWECTLLMLFCFLQLHHSLLCVLYHLLHIEVNAVKDRAL